VRFVVSCLGLLALCCVAAPPGPRGPLRGAGIEGAFDMSLALNSAQAVREDGTTVSGSSDHYSSDFAVVPRRLELRLSPIDWMDIGGDIGWLDGGLDFRLGVPDYPSRVFAGNVAIGIRSGQPGFFRDTQPARSTWARLEAYPLVGAPDQRLLLSIGAHTGTFYHELGGAGVFGDWATQVMRREVRIEGGFGFFTARYAGSLLLALEPYVVVDSGAALASGCPGCDTVRYHQDWGCVLVLRLALAWRAPWAKSKQP